MRVAILSDIHGNSIALDAVRADIEAVGGVDAYWVLGDLAAIGPDPIGALERLVALPNATFVRGNTDRYAITNDRPWPYAADVVADPSLAPRFDEVERSFAWTRTQVVDAGWDGWLAALPLEARLELPDRTRAQCVHASPGSDDGPGLRPNQSDDERRALLRGCEADLLAVGHTHWAGRLDVDGVDVLAVGSVSNPLPSDLRASFVLLEADESGYRAEHRRVAYDLDAVISATEVSGHPAAGWIISRFRGRHDVEL